MTENNPRTDRPTETGGPAAAEPLPGSEPDTGLAFRLTAGGRSPEVSRPAADRLLAGDPVFSTWTLEDRDGLYCGIWQATPGKWRVRYDEWEYCRILSGVSVVTGPDGTAHSLRSGDSFVIRPGFDGTWEVVETTVKDFVIRL